MKLLGATSEPEDLRQDEEHGSRAHTRELTARAASPGTTDRPVPVQCLRVRLVAPAQPTRAEPLPALPRPAPIALMLCARPGPGRNRPSRADHSPRPSASTAPKAWQCPPGQYDIRTRRPDGPYSEYYAPGGDGLSCRPRRHRLAAAGCCGRCDVSASAFREDDAEDCRTPGGGRPTRRVHRPRRLTLPLRHRDRQRETFLSASHAPVARSGGPTVASTAPYCSGSDAPLRKDGPLVGGAEEGIAVHLVADAVDIAV